MVERPFACMCAPMAATDRPAASFVIATKDRPDDLRRVLRSIAAQDVEVEVIVMDDGSEPGALDFLPVEFPQVAVDRTEASEGSIRRRNAGAARARGDIVFLVDDDVELGSPAIVSQTLRDFEHPRVGVVALPLQEPRKGGDIVQRAPDAAGVTVANAYIGAGSAVRRDVFVGLGGFWPPLFHRHEEGEFALRMMEAGYVVRLGRADPTRHFESPRRASAWMLRSWGRNELLTAWRDVPMPYVIGRVAKVVGNVLLHTRSRAEAPDLLAGLALGVRESLRLWDERDPVRRRTYQVARRLRLGGPLPIEQVEPSLPPPARMAAS